MPYHRRMQELVFEVVQESDGGYCAECLTESIFTEADTWEDLRKNVLEATSAFSLIVHCPTEFAFILYATRSCPSHEDTSRRFGCASHCCLVPEMAVQESTPGRQPHHLGDVRTDSPPDRDSGPPPASAWDVKLDPARRCPAQECGTRCDHRRLVSCPARSRLLGSNPRRQSARS